jgi:hypothetical protein
MEQRRKMSELEIMSTVRHRMRKEDRPITIELPDGKVLEQRAHFAEKRLGVTEKTLQRWNVPTALVGNVAYVEVNASLGIVAKRIRQRNEPRRRNSR